MQAMSDIAKPLKPTVANAKKLGADRFGWAGFKHRLMEALGVPPAQWNTWSVSQEWQDAFKKANGRQAGKSSVGMSLKNAGNSWNNEEHEQLLAEFDAGATLEELVSQHKRTPNAIVSKLAMLGRLTDIARGYRKVAPDEWVSFDEIKSIHKRHGTNNQKKHSE